MSFSATELTQLSAGLPRLGIFFRLEADPVVRLWAGVGNIEPGVNAFDLTGATYKGTGEIAELPAISHLFDGTADRVEFTLSGISPTALAEIAPQLAAQQAAIQGVIVTVGWVAMNTSWVPLSAIHWEWFGFADLIRLRHQSAPDAHSPQLITLSLSCGDWMTGRRRAGLSFMVDHDQKQRSAALNPLSNPDRFCERVGLYHAGVEKRWPAA